MSIWSGYIVEISKEAKDLIKDTDSEIEWQCATPNTTPEQLINSDYNILIHELVRRGVFDV